MSCARNCMRETPSKERKNSEFLYWDLITLERPPLSRSSWVKTLQKSRQRLGFKSKQLSIMALNLMSGMLEVKLQSDRTGEITLNKQMHSSGSLILEINSDQKIAKKNCKHYSSKRSQLVPPFSSFVISKMLQELSHFKKFVKYQSQIKMKLLQLVIGI